MCVLEFMLKYSWKKVSLIIFYVFYISILVERFMLSIKFYVFLRHFVCLLRRLSLLSIYLLNVNKSSFFVILQLFKESVDHKNMSIYALVFTVLGE